MMHRLFAMLLVALAGTGCLIPHSSGYSHVSDGLKGPLMEILLWDDEPAVAMLLDSGCSLEVRRHEDRFEGKYGLPSGRVVSWKYAPDPQDPKHGVLSLTVNASKDPQENESKPLLHVFDTRQGRFVMLWPEDAGLRTQQVIVDEKKLREVAKRHRSGMGAQDVTLESKDTWQVIAEFNEPAESLQKRRMTPDKNGVLPDQRTLGKNPTVQSNHQQYVTKEGPKRRSEGFYHLVKSIESAAERGPVTQCEAIRYLGAPQHVFEYSDRKPDGKTVMRQLYHYDLTGTLNGTIIHVECVDGLFKSMAFLPAGKSD